MNSFFSKGLPHPGPESADFLTIGDSNSNAFKWFTQSSDFDVPTAEPKPQVKKKKRSLAGGLTRVFSRSRLRRSIAVPQAESVAASDGGFDNFLSLSYIMTMS